MTIFDRFKIKAVAGAGLCGAAIALSPDAAATPLMTGGYACVQGTAGETAPAAVAGGPVAVAGDRCAAAACAGWRSRSCIPARLVRCRGCSAGARRGCCRCLRVLRCRRVRRFRRVLRFRRARVPQCRLVLR